MTDGSFEEALSEHLGALQARDIERFAPTVGDSVIVIDGGGSILRGRDSVLDSHARWFASNDLWSFDYQVHFARDVGQAGLALVDVTYRQTPADSPSCFFLSFVFERSPRGRWELIFDQNTGHAGASR